MRRLGRRPSSRTQLRGAVAARGRRSAATRSARPPCRTDPKISVASMQKPGFQFLWKRKLGARPQSLTQPLLLPNIIAYKGFKALAFVGGSADNVYSIDYDLNRMFWEQHLGDRGLPTDRGDGRVSPGGLTAIDEDDGPLRPPPVAAGWTGVRGGGQEAAAVRAVAGHRGRPRRRRQRVRDLQRRHGARDESADRHGSDSAGEVPSGPTRRSSARSSSTTCSMRRRRATAPARRTASGRWISLSDAKTVTLVGLAGGRDRRRRGAHVRDRQHDLRRDRRASRSPVSNAIVSLEPKTLTQKDWFTAADRAFTSAPVSFQHKRQGPRSWRRTRMAACTCSTAHRLAAPITRRRFRRIVAVLERGAGTSAGLRRGSMRPARAGLSSTSSGPRARRHEVRRWRTAP